MAQEQAKCTNCGELLLIDSEKDAFICPKCNNPFVTEKAIALFNGQQIEPSENDTKSNDNQSATKPKKKRHILKSLGAGLLMTVKCIGYLIYVVTLMWLFFDIVDDIKKK